MSGTPDVEHSTLRGSKRNARTLRTPGQSTSQTVPPDPDAANGEGDASLDPSRFLAPVSCSTARADGVPSESALIPRGGRSRVVARLTVGAFPGASPGPDAFRRGGATESTKRRRCWRCAKAVPLAWGVPALAWCEHISASPAALRPGSGPSGRVPRVGRASAKVGLKRGASARARAAAASPALQRQAKRRCGA